MRSIILIFATLLVCVTVSAQETEKELLAREYMQMEDYTKAGDLYADIFKKNDNTYVYDNYLTCLIKTENWKTAEKIIAKQIKKEPSIPRFQIDQGYVYLLQNKKNDADKTFRKTISQFGKTETGIIDLSKTFEIRELDDWKLLTLTEGKKTIPSSINIRLALAEHYRKTSKNESMIDEYLSLLENTTYHSDELKKVLQDIIAEDKDGTTCEIFRSRILKKLQKDPSNTEYTNLLIWYYIQIFDFDKAVMQAQAYEKRNKGDGDMVLDVAELCISNKQWSSAEKALNYLIDLGPEKPFYNAAKAKILEVRYEQLCNKPESTKEDFEQLAAEMRTTINESFFRNESYNMTIMLSELEAYRLREPEKAEERLQKLLKTGGFSNVDYAKVKLLLGDIMIVKGDVWEASLLYSQVEKAFKHDTIGYYAKYRNARLYYFLGEFDYAIALLDILRGSTSKLIANDAMELSLTIQDNVDYDSSYVPLEKFATAEMLNFAMKYDSAIAILDTILMAFPGHPIFDETLYKKAEILIKQKKYENAVEPLKEILASNYFDILGDNALMLLAKLYEKNLNDKEKAQDNYLKIIQDFPGSILVPEAQQRFRALRGDIIN